MIMSKNAVGNLMARYKSVLQNCSLLNTFGSLALAGALVLGGASGALAGNTYYSGAVTTLTDGSENFVIAGGSTAEVGSTSLTITGGQYTGKVFGGGYATEAEASANVAGDVSLNITGGTVTNNIIGGGVTETSGVSATAGNVVTTISGGTHKASFLIGGGMCLTSGNASVTSATTVLNAAEASFTSAVGGGYAYNGGTANADTVNFTLNSGTVTNLYGAGFSHNGNVKSDNVTLNVNGGTVGTDIYASGWAQNGGQLAVANTALNFAGGETSNIIGGAGAAGTGTQASVTDTVTVNMSGGTVKSTIYGGGHTGSYSDSSSTVKNVELNISGGEVGYAVYAGGYAGSTATCTVETATVTVTGGTVNGTIYGRGSGDSATVGDSILNLGTVDAGYSAKINAFQDFNTVNVASGANVNVARASFIGGSNFTIDLSSSSFIAESISTEAGAILNISGAGTLECANADIELDSWGVKQTVATSATTGTSGAGTTLVDYDATTLTVAELLKVVDFSYEGTNYSVTVAADTDAIAEAAGPNAANGMPEFIADTINNDPDTDGAAFVRENAGQTEDAAKLAALGGVIPGLSNASAAATNNVNTRVGMAQQNKPTAASETSTFLAMNGDGVILPAADGNMAQGLGIWFMPMFSHTSADGFSSGNSKYGFDTNIAGATLGADYTFASDLRLGLAFNVGAGSASSKGDFEDTENDFNYVGVSLYGAKHFDQLGLSFDMGYTASENDMSQEHSVSDLYGTTDASLFTVGAKAEYLIPLDSFNVTPYAGIRYNYYNVDAYDTMQSGKSLFNTASTDNSVWEIPVGVTFDTTTQVGSWEMTPSLGLGVKFAMGDLDAEQSVTVTGGTSNIVLASEFADNVTFQGALGIGFAKDNCTLGVNYTLDLSENVESHGISATLRYEF